MKKLSKIAKRQLIARLEWKAQSEARYKEAQEHLIAYAKSVGKKVRNASS